MGKIAALVVWVWGALCLLAVAAMAEQVTETWRSPLGHPRWLSVNPTDSSCWAATGSSITHLAADGTILSETKGLWAPHGVSANQADGSCWVANTWANEVVHLAADGTELWRGGGFAQPLSVSVNHADGSCWVADTEHSQVVHLAPDGSELLRVTTSYRPESVSVNASDGSCWVGTYCALEENSEVLHLAAGGTTLWQGCASIHSWAVAVNAMDRSCWVAGDWSLRHLAADGTQLWQGGFGYGDFPSGVTVNPTDGSCWAFCPTKNKIVHLSAEGVELFSVTSLGPASLSVNATDGSCWVADPWDEAIIHLAADATEIWRTWAPWWKPSFIVPHPTDGSCWVGDNRTADGLPAGPEGTVSRIDGDGQELLRVSTGKGMMIEGAPASGSVDGSDGSCWVGNRGKECVDHLAPNGAALWTAGGFHMPLSVSVNSTDGTCWIADSANNGVVCVAPGGGRIRAGLYGPQCVSVNSTDGSCWVADTDNGRVARLSADHRMQWADRTFKAPVSVSVNVSDGSGWVADSGGGNVRHLSAIGTELRLVAGFEQPACVSVNPNDGSCWVADTYHHQIVHLDQYGSQLWRGSGYWRPESVSVNPADSSCWVADTGHRQVVHLSADGAELWRGGTFTTPKAVAVDPVDGSCWVADSGRDEAVHLSVSGTELWRGSDYTNTDCVCVNPADGSVWVNLPYWNEVRHLSKEGVELCGLDGGLGAGLSVNPSDGSCWIVDGWSQVLHVTDAGELLWAGLFDSPEAVAVNADHGGSCWVADIGHDQLVLLSAAGDEIMRLDGFPWTTRWSASYLGTGCISADRSDGSCWVADTGHRQVVHVGLDGTELWRGGSFVWPLSVSANAMDGSCWVADWQSHQVVHLAADGTEIWRGGGFCNPQWVAVEESDGSCWVADTGNSQLAHLELAPGPFSDVPYWHWAEAYIKACFNAGIVGGFEDGTYRPSLPVTRDQMAVYISRALAGGDEHVPTGPATPTFTDVPTDHWAYQWVEYAVANGIVQGYSPTVYAPSVIVDRAQMAVFVSRSIVTPHGDDGLTGYTPPATPTFPDVPAGHWAYKYIEYIAQDSVAVSQGYDDGTYRPDVIVTRDQMAVYVQKAFDLPM